MPDHEVVHAVELDVFLPGHDEATIEHCQADPDMEISLQEGFNDSDTKHLNSRVVRKLDFILLPFLALLFLSNSLDRSNVYTIGNAETADFTKDIGLDPGDLNSAVAVFYVFFVALQPIGAALGRRYGMVRWVPTCMTIWGFCTGLHIWVRSKWQLIALRTVIGVLEAGFYPTTVSYLSLFYTRYEFGRRLGIFYGQYAIAGALGGLLSFAVFTRFPHHDIPPENSIRSWQVLFLLEGGVTIILAMTGFFWLPHNAKTAWFLKPEERLWAEQRIEQDLQGDNPKSAARCSSSRREEDEERQTEDNDEVQGLLNDSDARFSIRLSTGRPATDDRGISKEDLVEAVCDWKLWYLLTCNVLSAIPVTAFSVFLPLVLKPLATTPAYANLLAAPPFLFGAVVLYCFAHWSDHSRSRIIPILWSLGLLLVGLTGVVIIPTSMPRLRYACLCILLSGTFVASPLVIAWFTGNLPETGKRSAVLGINGWGNLAGVFSSLLFQPRFAPTYSTPFFITLALVSVAFIGFWGFRRLLIAENAHRQAIVDGWSTSEAEAEAQYGNGPLPAKRYPVLLGMSRNMTGNWLHQRLQETLRSGGRRGDDKMTFRYSL